jgi:hypothetical protein
MNPFGATVCYIVSDGLTPMIGALILDNEQWTYDFAREHLQKANHIWSFLRSPNDLGSAS